MNNNKKNKRGQVTLFIILGIILVVVILFAYFGGWLKISQSTTTNPRAYIEGCMLNSMKNVEKTFLDSNNYPNYNSSNYILYMKEKIPYLCVASEFYTPCVPQDPAMFLKIKKVMENKVAVDTENCMNTLYNDLDNEGYQVTKKPGVVKVDMTPGEITAVFNETLFFVKGENSYSLDKFEVDYQSKFYQMIKMEQTIVNYESTFCEFNKLNWMKDYPDLIISKTTTSDQTKVYTLQDRLTNRKIKFAIKTCVLPAGI